MYIYDYYIIIYDKFLDYQQKLENYKLEKKVENIDRLFNQNKNNDNIRDPNNKTKTKSNDINNLNDTCSNDFKINESNNIDFNVLTHTINSDNNTSLEKTSKKNISESGNWIKKIYTKLIFMYHPDKQISSSDEIFSKIKNDFDKNDFSSILYYFIKDKEHPYLSKLFNEMKQNKKFINSLLNLSNYIDYKINLIIADKEFINYLKQNNLFN